MIYDFICDTCNKEYKIVQKIEDIHVYTCPLCNTLCRRLFTTNFKIKGWSPGNEIKQDNVDIAIDKALKDDSEVTPTMIEVAKEQLEQRAKRRGEKSEEVIAEVFGERKEPIKKEDLAKKAKKQREMIDRTEKL
ncbi:MAG: FmdB family zinc ribbon protein [Clostridia bacterium]|jgi:putative FmdB family regulatory protein